MTLTLGLRWEHVIHNIEIPTNMIGIHGKARSKKLVFPVTKMKICVNFKFIPEDGVVWKIQKYIFKAVIQI